MKGTKMKNTPDLKNYDLILINSSGGKDSQAMLDHLAKQMDEQGISKDKALVIHADLGRMEWKGTGELAKEQAEHYGFKFMTVARPQGDLIDQVISRGMWPSNVARYCTSDQKRGQVLVAMTKLTREMKLDRPARILNCMGIRAKESTPRAKKNPFQVNKKATGKGKVKIVEDFFPIFDWTKDQVWACIKASGVRHHWAYDKGMPRLSCAFCFYAPKAALMIAGKHNPELLDLCCDVEEKIGHDFTQKLSLKQIRTSLKNGEAVEASADWVM